MSTLSLQYDYEFPKRVVYDWWTDLSGKGYVGKALRSIKPFGTEDGMILVETKWKMMMGMTKTLIERLTLIAEDHWIWQPTIFGIEITDDFRLESQDGGTILKIESVMRPKGIKGRLASIMFGSMLEHMMVNEWNSASDALALEVASALSEKS
jgi:hypothetical protein